MKREDLFEAIGSADDELLMRSDTPVVQKKMTTRRTKNAPRRGIALAACFCLVCGSLFGLFRLGLFEGSGSGGSGHDKGSTTFMSYAGPVFPLTTAEPTNELHADRAITMDFEPWIDAPNDIRVIDNYVLTNTSSEDQTVDLLYPFVANLIYLGQNLPQLTVDGAEIPFAPSNLVFGEFSGGFVPAYGSPDDSELMNLESPNSWEAYKSLLSDGRYLVHALDGFDYPQLNETVVVYRFTDEYAPKSTDSMPNPTVRAIFTMDYDKTKILTYGFNQGLYDQENKIRGIGYSLQQPDARQKDWPTFIAILGEDIGDIALSYYVTGGWDTKETLDDGSAGVTVTRQEMLLGDILLEAAKASWTTFQDNMDTSYSIYGESPLTFEQYYGLYCDYLFDYVLSEAIARYDSGSLQELDVESASRVCYLKHEITIPAGGSIELSFDMTKEASFDYTCAHTENRGIAGYDVTTKLGSTLSIRKATATLLDRGLIEITNQNFGFNLDTGLTTVPIDDEEHYYLEVRKKRVEE